MFKRTPTSPAVFLIAVGSLISPALGQNRPDTTPDSALKEFAHEDTFDSVVSVWSRFGAEWRYKGTGFYLGNGWFGHSAHQMLIEGNVLPDEVRIYSGRDSWNYEHLWYGDQIEVYPGYTYGTAAGHGADLGLTHVPGIVDLEPVTRSYIPEERGMVFRAASFGMYGTASNPNQGDDYQMRGWENRADFFGGDSPFLNVEPQYMLAEFDPPGYAALPREAHTSPGCSGTPIFREVDGEWLVTGVLNGYRGGYGYFDQTLFLGLSPYNGWIDSIIPEPSTLLLLLAGSCVLGKRRR